MIKKRSWVLFGSVGLVCVAACGFAAGCKKPKVIADAPFVQQGVPGTISAWARFIDSGFMPVSGYGVVVGLGNNGGSDIPPRLQLMLTKYLSQHGVGSHRAGLEGVKPMELLRDMDTAIVRISGKIPPGAPAGTVFDIKVEAIGSQVKSLDGGWLYTVDLRQQISGIDVAVTKSKVLASAQGPVYINPFMDMNDPKNNHRLRAGRIVGGGKVTKSRLIHLKLAKSDWPRAAYIQQCVIERFSSSTSPKPAKAKDDSLINLKVPHEFRSNYHHFLQLVLHIPTRIDTDVFASELTEKILLPDADRDQISLTWEAMGRKIVPALRKLYIDKNTDAAFYAARAGMRLGDYDQAGEVLITFAQDPKCRNRLEAIIELGKHSEFYGAIGALHKLLDDDTPNIRIAAYTALLAQGDRGRVTSIALPDGLQLDIVDSNKQYAIYAAGVLNPRIVLFGKGMKINAEVFFETPDSLLTVNGKRSGEMSVWRALPKRLSTDPSISTPEPVDRNVRTFVTFLGEKAKWNRNTKRVKGLGLTYSQIVGVLFRMCEEGHIPAKFVLKQ